MNGPTHFVIGGATAGLGLWGAQRLGLPVHTATIFVGVAIGGVSALTPDIDTRHSIISRALPLRYLRVGLVLLLVPAVLGLINFLGQTEASSAALFRSFAKTPFFQWGFWIIVPPLILMGLSFLIAHVFGHRGATHSLVFTAGATLIAVVCCLIFHLPWAYGLIFGWGWLSHLLADAITPEGLPCLLWPFKRVGKNRQNQLFYLQPPRR